nr:chemotaxis protein CheW [uncultured Holophaga sp.]
MSLGIQDTAVAAAAAPPRQYLTFELDGRVYGIPMEDVAEITPNLPLNRIPHLPKGVEGVLDLRGSLLPVISLRVRLGLPLAGAPEPANILVLGLEGSRIGFLVDRVMSVHTARVEDHTPASPLLEGPEGAWVKAFLLVGKEIISLLDAHLISAIGTVRTAEGVLLTDSTEKLLDDGLKELIALAPTKTEVESTRIIPQMEAAIAHTEAQMAKVLDQVESMLVNTDQSFHALTRIKQEIRLGRMRSAEPAIAEAEKIGSEIQEQVFDLIQTIQYQDIARQKLERVLSHLRGLQMVVGTKFRDTGKHLL